MKQKVFLSNVQKEFAQKREALHRHLLSDLVLQLFFEPVLFEKLPALSQQPQKVYLKEVTLADLFLILIVESYSFETATGISPTELEYNLAQEEAVFSLAFIKNDTDEPRHPKETALLRKIQNNLSYKRFSTTEELIREVTKALVNLLQQKGLIPIDGFDSSIAKKASLLGIDVDKLNHFVNITRHKRGFAFREGIAVPKVLSHLNLYLADGITNSDLLAFGKNPQQFFPAAVVKFAHFNGDFIAKPIPDHRVIKGDIYMQVDEAIDFILAKIAVTVGMRLESNQAPLKHENPRPEIAEAIVNAVAHRDYQCTGSIQVKLFSDRVTSSNPGGLPMELTLEKLKHDHATYPKNPHLAETLYQADYIERFSTGTGEIFLLCASAVIREPTFNLEEGFSITIYRPTTGQVFTDLMPIERAIWVVKTKMKRDQIQEALEIKQRDNLRKNYLNPAIKEGWVEMTIPDKPAIPKQTYRLTRNRPKKKKDFKAKNNYI
jgi:ATP-dependent DNA helicase RecG